MQCHHLSLQHQNIPVGSGHSLLCHISICRVLPIVATPFWRLVLDKLHNVSHSGIHITHKLIAPHFVWHGRHHDISNWAKACLPCQQSKVHNYTASPHQDFEMPIARFQHIHVDIVGPLQPSKGYSYLFTMVDCFTR